MRLDQPQARMLPLCERRYTDENGRVCVAGLGPCALLLKAQTRAPTVCCCCYAPIAGTACTTASQRL